MSLQPFRVARNCFEADSLIPARCDCCGAVKLMLLDERDRVRAIAEISVEQLRGLLAEAEAGRLPTFDVREGGAARAVH